MPRVVILSNHSVFVEGIAKRLQQQLATSEIETIDARAADAVDQVLAAQPAILILEATGLDWEQSNPLCTLLNSLASLTIIRLDHEQDRIQVLTSKQQSVSQVSDLIALIRAAA